MAYIQPLLQVPAAGMEMVDMAMVEMAEVTATTMTIAIESEPPPLQSEPLLVSLGYFLSSVASYGITVVRQGTDGLRANLHPWATTTRLAAEYHREVGSIVALASYLQR